MLSIFPGEMRGVIAAPSSKSAAHRHLIIAALAEGESVLYGITPSKDTDATIRGLQALGASFKTQDDGGLFIKPIRRLPDAVSIDCGECGATLRFLIPLAAALGVQAVFSGHGRLPSRPLTGYLETLKNHGASINYSGVLPLHLSGKLSPGAYFIEGEKSSQYLTGLLLALPVLKSRCCIYAPGSCLGPYVDITTGIMKDYGVTAMKRDGGYRLTGDENYQGGVHTVEGDWSGAAFLLCIGVLAGDVSVKNLKLDSTQGDRMIFSIIKQMGGDITAENGVVRARKSKLSALDLDMTDLPDIVPVTAVMCACAEGRSTLRGVDKLRFKESDRIESTLSLLRVLGGSAFYENDSLVIDGTGLRGGFADSMNDHRIAMSAAVAACGAGVSVTLSDGQCVDKSYTRFWDDFKTLGGRTR